MTVECFKKELCAIGVFSFLPKESTIFVPITAYIS